MPSETLVKHSSPSPPEKRQKQENQQQHQFPPSFWDGLSRLWLTRRCLREFDRRTVWSPASLQPDRSGEDSIHLAQLKRFARHGGPSLTDLRAYPESKSAVRTMVSGQPKKPKKPDESKNRNTSAYDPNFKDHLIRHGIYPVDYKHDRIQQNPRNWEEIVARLALTPASLSPSLFTPEKFRDFKVKSRGALDETEVMKDVIPLITASSTIPSRRNLVFGNLKNLTDDADEKLCMPKPDLYDGLPRSELYKLNTQILKQLGPYVIPSRKNGTPWLPNFFLEAKGPDGSTNVCNNQILYDGAMGARAMHQLRSYVDPQTAFDKKAYTIVSSYESNGTLQLYTMHPTQSKDPQKPIEYDLIPLVNFLMTQNLESFRQAVCTLWNARELAKEHREELIAAVICKAQRLENHGLGSSSHGFQSQPTDETIEEDQEDSSTNSSLSQSTDEDDEEYETSDNEPLLDTASGIRSTCRAPAGSRTNSSNQSPPGTVGGVGFTLIIPLGSRTNSSLRTSPTQFPPGTVSGVRSTRRTRVGPRMNPSPGTSPNQIPPGTVSGVRSTRRTRVRSRTDSSPRTSPIGLTRPARVGKRSGRGYKVPRKYRTP